MTHKLTSRQVARVAVLETFPPKFDHIHRAIEEIGTFRADESVARRLARMADEMKAAAASIGEGALADTLGVLGMLARRGGSVQTKVRGLRESFMALKINFDGAMKAATRDEGPAEAEEPTASP